MNLIDFVRCLSILVDNAFEAASMTEKPEIFLQVEKKEEHLTIILENNYSGNIAMEHIFRKNFTSKEGHSGKGLHNFIRILKQYPNASYTFDLRDVLFTAKDK